jgi:hypothetical protein
MVRLPGLAVSTIASGSADIRSCPTVFAAELASVVVNILRGRWPPGLGWRCGGDAAGGVAVSALEAPWCQRPRLCRGAAGSWGAWILVAAAGLVRREVYLAVPQPLRCWPSTDRFTGDAWRQLGDLGRPSLRRVRGLKLTQQAPRVAATGPGLLGSTMCVGAPPGSLAAFMRRQLTREKPRLMLQIPNRGPLLRLGPDPPGFAVAGTLGPVSMGAAGLSPISRERSGLRRNHDG